MDQAHVIGPVQFSMPRLAEPQLPAEIRVAFEELRGRSVRLVDALVPPKHTDVTIDQQTPPDLITQTQRTGVISRLLNRIEAEHNSMSTSASDTYGTMGARAAFCRGEPMSDHRDVIPQRNSALMPLIEHRWAVPVSDAVLRTNGTPLGNGWVGFRALRHGALISPESAMELACLGRCVGHGSREPVRLPASCSKENG